MKKGALLILISFFSLWDLFPQVTIKEKVEIKPRESFNNSLLTEHTIVFNLQWDRPGVQAAVVGVSIPCQSVGADWQYGVSISLTVENARAGLYWFQPRVNQNPYDTTNFYYQLYFDGVIVRNGSAVLIGAFSSGSYPHFDVQYTPPLISDYSFNLLSNELCYRKFGELDIGTSNNCATGISWNSSTNLINLSITSGQEFASFYHYDFNSYFPTVELLGDNIEVTLAELEDISLEQDSLFNGSNVKVNVRAEWGGLIKTDSATAYPASEYIVSAESFGVEEINAGEEVFMELDVLTDLNCSFCLPLYETYNAQIIKGGEYGSLIDPVSGESVQSLTGIEQYTFGPGMPCGIASLDYIADGISADMEDSIIIRISTSDPQIQPTDKLFLIQPSLVLVTITPDKLSPGDTASIVIKKRNPDGTIEDFPPDQTFEIGIAEGCLGNLLACDGEDCYLEPYFYGIPDSVGVYFVADSSADSGTVKIRVGLIDDGGVIGAGKAAQMGTSGFKRVGKEKTKAAMKKNRSLEEKASFIKDVKSKINNSALSISEKDEVFGKLNSLASPNSETSLCFVGDFVGSIYAIKNVVIETDSLDYFEIIIIPDTLAEKDTLAFAETAKLIIQAKNADSTDIEFNSNKLLTFRIETNEQYGTFIDANGDTLKITPVILNDISYGDAREGLIKFAAVKENPDSVVKCIIKVILQDDTSKTGEKEAVALEQTLRIVMDGDHEVQPVITSEYDDMGSTAYQNSINENNREFFMVRLTRGGKLVKNHRIKLNTNYIDGSGGHDHLTPRRPVTGSTSNLTERYRRLHYGSFYSYSSGTTFNAEFMRGMVYERSREDTVSRFEFVASIWGDEMKINLESLENSLLNKDSVIIIERIPDLQLLEAGGNYTLIGGTEEHSNVHNHYASGNVIQDIGLIANDWHEEFPNEMILQINDVSLPYGGKFDINGMWYGPHETHREGRDVDIRTELYYYDDNSQLQHRPGIPVRNPRTTPYRNLGGQLNSSLIGHLRFEQICEEHNGNADIHGDNSIREHYHIDFEN